MLGNGMVLMVLLVPVFVGGDRACPVPGHRTNRASPRQESQPR